VKNHTVMTRLDARSGRIQLWRLLLEWSRSLSQGEGLWDSRIGKIEVFT